MLKGIGGEYEINRVLGASGVAAYILSVPLFVGYRVFALGKDFDVVAFCAAYPTGLGIAIGAIAGAVSLKDRNVAVAQDVKAARATENAAATQPPAPVTKVEGDLNAEHIETVEMKP